MKPFKALLLLVCAVIIWFDQPIAREINTYKGKVSVPILENDIAFARNNAFLTLQNLLLSAAIQDLVGSALFEEYKYEISKNKQIKPSKFLISAKVLNELVEGENFTMELEGKIQVSALTDALKKMNLVLKSDPWVEVGVLLNGKIDLPIFHLKERLKRFHINISDVQKIDLSELSWEDRGSAEFVEALFLQAPQSKIVYFIDLKEPPEGETAPAFLFTQIYRQADSGLINEFQISLPAQEKPGVLDKATIDRFLRLFSIPSLKLDSYDVGLSSMLTLKTEGLSEPYVRSVFENQMLIKNRSIKSFILTQISFDTAEYQLQTNYTLDELESYFKTKNPYFYFITEKLDASLLQIETFHKHTDGVSELPEWEPQEQILAMIAKTLNPEPQVEGANEGVNSLFAETTLDETYLPKLKEKEPNDNARNLDGLPPDTLMIGYISSRADEDLYQLKRNVESSTLVVEWLRIGKTTLSPQLRLYDQAFNYMSSYNLIGSQNKMKFSYTFEQGAPRKVFLRVTDKMGFIQGETGGFKSFHYLLKYHWETGVAESGEPNSSRTLPGLFR